MISVSKKKDFLMDQCRRTLDYTWQDVNWENKPCWVHLSRWNGTFVTELFQGRMLFLAFPSFFIIAQLYQTFIVPSKGKDFWFDKNLSYYVSIKYTNASVYMAASNSVKRADSVFSIKYPNHYKTGIRADDLLVTSVVQISLRGWILKWINHRW